MKLIKKACWVLALILALGPMLGCALFNRHEKNDEGYYEAHYQSCGPIALSRAFNAFYAKQGIVFARNPAPVKEVSQKIQKSGMSFKECLSYFDKDSIQITWPSEIKKIANEYGFDLITIDDLEGLDPSKDVAIVLIHGKLFSKQFHWVVYSIDDIKDFYGKETVIDIIYLLKRKGKL